MKNTDECIPCYLGLILDILDELDLKEEQRKLIVARALSESNDILEGLPTPAAMKNVAAEINHLSGGKDPYKEFKEASTRAALQIYPRLEKIVDESEDSFARAVEFAVAGNSIDLVAMDVSDLSGIIEWMQKLSDSDFAINHIDRLEAELKEAATVLYIGDNAGETVFDRLVLKQIKAADLFYGVRGGPVLNDSTEEDARQAGIDAEATIISSGIPAPGILLDEVDRKFYDLFNEADVVIAKGQGNFESLHEIPRPVYNLFKAKCDLVARHVGCELNSFIAWRRTPQ